VAWITFLKISAFLDYISDLADEEQLTFARVRTMEFPGLSDQFLSQGTEGFCTLGLKRVWA
jgi:hypothetical protein